MFGSGPLYNRAIRNLMLSIVATETLVTYVNQNPTPTGFVTKTRDEDMTRFISGRADAEAWPVPKEKKAKFQAEERRKRIQGPKRGRW